LADDFGLGKWTRADRHPTFARNHWEYAIVMSLLKRFGRRLAAVSAIAASACTAAPAAEPAAASPALWQVADEDTTIYLFGTIHLLPKDTKWRSAEFDKAVAGADTLVVETIVDEQNPSLFAEEFKRLATSPGLPPLLDRVEPEKRTALRETLARFKISENGLDGLETWAAAVVLVQLQLLEIGLDPKSGVESTLKAQFTDGGKPIGQLESNGEQLSYFDTLPEAVQRKFLTDVLDDSAALKGEFDGMLATWSKGDVKGIANTFNSELADDPELRDALLVLRNANWAKWVKARLDQPGTVMVAVGAGHLAGDQSVLRLLENQGLKVRRVQ
jgi:uncharacterized protein